MNGQTEDTKVEVMFRGCETKEMGGGERIKSLRTGRQSPKLPDGRRERKKEKKSEKSVTRWSGAEGPATSPLR